MPSSGFIERFRQQVIRTPNAPAVVWRDQTLSYAELDELAGRARTAAAAMPAGPVCVPAAKSPGTLALLLGCWMNDRTVLLPSVELSDAVLTALAELAHCRCLAIPAVDPDGAFTIATRALGPAGGEPATATPSWSVGTRLLLTTSGSTGVPKIVPMSPDGVDAFIDWASAQFRIAPEASVLNYAPLNFDLSLLDVWTALATGATTVLVDPDQATNGDHLRTLVRSNHVTVVQSVPLFFRLLTEASSRHETFPGVRSILVTGDAIPEPLLDSVTQQFPQARVFNVYGCTETNDSIVHEVHSFARNGAKLPIGHPLPGVEIRLLDREKGSVIDGPGIEVISTVGVGEVPGERR